MELSTQIHEVPEEELISSAVQGDLDAFNELVLVYQNRVFHHAYNLLGDPAAAEDAAQESFLKAYLNIHSFRGGSFRAWLFKIVTNTCYDLLRQSRRQRTQPLFPGNEGGEAVEDPDWLIDPAPSILEQVERKEALQQLDQLLAVLPEAYRSVLTLVDLNELDYAEAAQALGVPTGTIKSRLARARVKMRALLQEPAEGKCSLARPHPARSEPRKPLQSIAGSRDCPDLRDCYC